MIISGYAMVKNSDSTYLKAKSNKLQLLEVTVYLDGNHSQN